MKVFCRVEGLFDTLIVIQPMGDFLLTTVPIMASIRLIRILYEKTNVENHFLSAWVGSRLVRQELPQRSTHASP